MLIESCLLAENNELSTDVCVVGSGPAGLTTASRLAREGVRVLLIECGPSDPRPGGEDLDTARNVGWPYALRHSRAQGIGGTSHRWNIVTPLGAPYLRLRELDDDDFQPRPGAPSSWPFDKSTLDPWYREAWRTFGLEPPGRDADDVVLGNLERRVMSFGPAETFTRRLPQEVRGHPAVTVVTGLRATELRCDEKPGNVTSLACRTAAGRRVTVRATVYVLATGGIENARLLLASRSGSPRGLGNAHDLVGRYMTEHLHFPVGVVLPGPGRRLDPRWWACTARDGRVQQPQYTLRTDVLRRERLLSSSFFLVPRARVSPVLMRRDSSLDVSTTVAADDLRVFLQYGQRMPYPATELARLLSRSRALGTVGVREIAEEIRRRRSAGEVARAYTVEVMTEQQQNRESRVRLGELLDCTGQPVAELDWRVHDVDVASVRRTQGLLGPLFAEALDCRFESLLDGMPTPRLQGGNHHMGTTRMAASPRLGVVDSDCRVHGVGNLYVAGSSVFPTNGFANPTLTLVALAARLADHLARSLRLARASP